VLISKKQQAQMKTVGENKQVILFICFWFIVIFDFCYLKNGCNFCFDIVNWYLCDFCMF